MKWNVFMGALFCATAAMAGPEVQVRLGEPTFVPVEGLTIGSSPEGSDALVCLREGEWSVAQVTLQAHRSAPPGDTAVTLRIVGGSERAPVPALVRRGKSRADGPVLETYIRNAHRDGDDVVATVPYPLVPGTEDRYDLVDQSESIDWRQEPQLEPDPRDQAPIGGRRPLVLIPGDELGSQGQGPRDARLGAFSVLRDAPGYRALLKTHKPYLFRYAAYRDRAELSAALAKLIREKLGARVALIAHADGAKLMRDVMEAPGMRRQVTSALTLGEGTPARVLAGLAGR